MTEWTVQQVLDPRIVYEVAYWQSHRKSELHRARYARALRLWGVPDDPARVLEFGPGPIGGCLPLLPASGMLVGFEPLLEVYEAAGVLVVPPHVQMVGGAEWLALHPETFDWILTMNALDHGDGTFDVLSRLTRLLRPGGRWGLHVHLRTEAQLNVGHDHVLTEAAVRSSAESVELRSVRWTVYDHDPTEPETRYRTLVAVLER